MTSRVPCRATLKSPLFTVPKASSLSSVHFLDDDDEQLQLLKMDGGSDATNTHLTWANVGLGFAFIVFDALVSQSFGLGVGIPLVSAAVRCVVQLTVMSFVLQKIFEADNIWGIFGIASEFAERALLNGREG